VTTQLLAARYSSLLAHKKNPENERQLLSEEEFLGARLAARVLAKDKETDTPAATPTTVAATAVPIKGKDKETIRPPLPSLKEALASSSRAAAAASASEAAKARPLSATAAPFHPTTTTTTSLKMYAHTHARTSRTQALTRDNACVWWQ
jgi:hypothetical protein